MLRSTLTATDPDHDAVSFWPEPLPAGATLDAAGRFTWTPDFTQAGSYELVLNASDNHAGNTQTVRVPVTVTNTTVPTVLRQEVQVRRNISVTGKVQPASGGAVLVELYRKVGNTFELVAGDSPALNGYGKFSISFARPNATGTCRIDTNYPGAEPYQASSASTTFKC
jgi:hypothetical protein